MPRRLRIESWQNGAGARARRWGPNQPDAPARVPTNPTTRPRDLPTRQRRSSHRAFVLLSINSRQRSRWQSCPSLGRSIYRERDSSRINLEANGLLEAIFENAFFGLQLVCTLAHDSLLWCTLLVQLRTPLAGARLIH
jgi:hypothetical protein